MKKLLFTLFAFVQVVLVMAQNYPGSEVQNAMGFGPKSSPQVIHSATPGANDANMPGAAIGVYGSGEMNGMWLGGPPMHLGIKDPMIEKPHQEK